MNVSEDLIRAIVQQVLNETQNAPAAADFEKIVDKSGIIKVTTDTVKTERFEKDGVSLKDVLTLEEAPRISAGLMELKDGSNLEWTLTYDEIDICLEGHLEIEIDGRVLKAGPGELIYIPKGSHIHFQTPDYAKYWYVVYPANWSEL